MLYIAIASRSFFGAERRYFKIIRYLLDHREGQVRVRLLITVSLYRSALEVGWAAAVLRTLDQGGNLAVLPDKWSQFRHCVRPLLFARGVFGKSPFHALLRARFLAYLRSTIGLRASIEATSPDVADRIALEAPYFALNRLGAIRSVSPTVTQRLTAGFGKRFGVERASALVERIQTATSPFYDASDSGDEGAAWSDAKANVVVSASRFIDRKNVVMIADALAEALPLMPGWRAKVLGTGPLESEIRDRLHSLIREGRVDVGYEATIEPTLRSSRVYVSMIEPDNYPSQGVLEAMRFRNAVVLSDTGDSRLFFAESSEQKNLVPLDSHELASRLVDLASSPDDVEASGLAAEARIRGAFSPGGHVDELLAACVG